MVILLTGANGQLGQSLRNTFKSNHDLQLIPMDRTTLDITNPSSIKAAFSQYQPNIVINTAAYTAVDAAENEQNKAYEINVEAPRQLAEACEKNRAKLIHFSTDYVFNGQKESPYEETDACDPLSIYGKTKWLGEQEIEKIFDHYIVLRVSWLFSEFGHNFLKTILRLLDTKPELRIVNDQIGCPTYAGHIAEVLKEILIKHSQLTGTYHYADQPQTSWYGFAKKIQEFLVKDYQAISKEIFPIKSTEYLVAATRPSNSVLSVEKLKYATGISAYSWESGIQKSLSALLPNYEE